MGTMNHIVPSQVRVRAGADRQQRDEMNSFDRRHGPSLSPLDSHSSSLPHEVISVSKWPTGGFEPSWMDPTSSDEDDNGNFFSLDHCADSPHSSDIFSVGPRQPFVPIRRPPLEPLLPQRFNSPSVFLDSDRTGYHVRSLSLGSFDERTFRRFDVEREVPIENGRLALQAGGIDLSGYGFEHSPAFHFKFLPGSVQALYLLVPPNSERKEEEEATLIFSTLQTPVFRASISARADYDETSTARVSALDQEHLRLVPYLSRHFLLRLSFDPNETLNPNETLPSSLENLLFDLCQLDGYPSPINLDPATFSTTTTTVSNPRVCRYSRQILQDLSSAFGEFDSPTLTFPLEWISRDSTLYPSEILLLIEEHVRAWEVTVDYDEEVVEEILYELRTRLVEKRQARFERFKRREIGWENDDKVRFEGVEREAELARQRVVERRGAGGSGRGGASALLGRSGNVSKKEKAGRGKGRATLEERGRRNLYWARSVVLTPSGTIKIQGKSIDKTNSIVRSNFDGVDHFLRVAFKEEDGLLLGTVGGLEAEAQHELLDGTVARVLKGGLILGGRKFELLSYSQASLRDGAAVFLAPFPSSVVRNGIRQTRLIDAAQVRLSMGYFDKVSHQPAMLGARWSQSFTATSASVVLRDHQIHEISDLSEFDEEGKEITCHTDGSGLLSPKLRDSICQTLIDNGYRLSSTAPFPSVFQFRLGGYKGVLAIDNTQEGIGIAVRPSQEKYSGVAEHDEGDSFGASFVLNIAEAFDRPRPLRLNRPLISALEDLGIDASVFLRYQRQAVSSLDLPEDASIFHAAHAQLVGSALGGPSGFQKLLKSFAELKSLPPSLLRDEPFLRQALEVVRVRILRSYKYHASIPLPNCYLLVGVPDEDGVLEEDEVYIALRDPRWPTVIRHLEGRIAITRSPTVDAGDVRVVNAIGKFEGRARLTSLENCVVLPTKGKRSLCSMMGGGDLDGDTYQIITRPDLIPEKMFPPASHEAKPPLTLDRSATIEDVADCFVHYLENNLVGSIATKHLFVSDKSSEHGRDPIAIKLADLHSHAVDSPKTGQVVLADDLPSFPDWLKRERPDFLQGENRDYAFDTGYYPSDRALGQLYRDIDHETLRIPEELTTTDDTSATLPSTARDCVSPAFETLRSIIDDRIVKLLDTPLESLRTFSLDVRSSSPALRKTFCSHLRDLATVHSFPRTGGRRLSEIEVFAVTNLAVSTRDMVARGNAVVALGMQLDSIVDWLKREIGAGEEGIRKARSAWLLGIDEEEERKKGGDGWEYGERSFRWICLSILLEKLVELEGKKGESQSRDGEQAQDLIDFDSPPRPKQDSPIHLSDPSLSNESPLLTNPTPPPVRVEPPSPTRVLNPTRRLIQLSSTSSPLPLYPPGIPLPPSLSRTELDRPPHLLPTRHSDPRTPFLPLRSSSAPISPPPPPPPPRAARIERPKPSNRPRSTPLDVPRIVPNPDDPDPWQTESLIRSIYHHHHHRPTTTSSSSSSSFGSSPGSHLVPPPPSSSSSTTSTVLSILPFHRIDSSFEPEDDDEEEEDSRERRKRRRRREKLQKLRQRRGKINVESGDAVSSSSSSDEDDDKEGEGEGEGEEEEMKV